MEYNNINELRQQWLSGDFDYPEELVVAGVPYKQRSSSNHTFQDVITNKSKAYVIYQTSATHRDEAKEKGLQQWIVFVWGVGSNSTVKPLDVRPVAPQRFVEQHIVEDSERIGDVAILKIFLPSGTSALKGKVDTGAEISSLHADSIEVLDGNVRFTNKELSNNTITMPIAEQQAVKSADGGVEYRPVIELDIEINGKPVSGVLFNLNNRDHMEYPCLIGQNVLEKTNFLVDPKIDDPAADVKEETEVTFDEDDWLLKEDATINFESLDKAFSELEDTIVSEKDEEELERLCELFEDSNVTLGDLLCFIRTDARKVLDDIEY